jgi:large subunit ribosomal protein L7e
LLNKRGSFKAENNEVQELDNEMIENHLGKFNILCTEDIVHELSNCGDHFNHVMNFLGFFLLSKTEEVKDKVNIPFSKGGNQGFRGDNMDELLKKMI